MAQLQKWTLEPQIGVGGFAQVFLAHDEQGQEVVLKLVPKDPKAGRELLFADDLSGTPHIIPVIETIVTETHYVLVMPRAERSLREELRQQGGKLSVDSAVQVMSDVAVALGALQNRNVVHRDLKPENILLWNGHWCLADFGISRYAEATTSDLTQKFAMTWPYAAPEQWRHERATARTDVYAFGVMGFEMLEGQRPFPGPDFRTQHLQTPPPPITQGPTPLRQLVEACLTKAPLARPTPERLLNRLERIDRNPTPAAAQLQVASLAVAREEAARAATEAARQTREQERQLLYTAATASLNRIVIGLREEIQEHAPAAVLDRQGPLSVTLGQASLTVNPIRQVGDLKDIARGYNLRFDIVAVARIEVRRPADRYGYKGRSHSLWYCDAQVEDEYRWFETAFTHSWSGQRASLEPFALDPDTDSLIALHPVMHTTSVARPFMAIDQGEEEAFYERWIGWFSAAAQGGLGLPNSSVEGHPQGSWR